MKENFEARATLKWFLYDLFMAKMQKKDAAYIAKKYEIIYGETNQLNKLIYLDTQEKKSIDSLIRKMKAVMPEEDFDGVQKVVNEI